MKIGIVSDTHGRADRLRAALSILADRGVQAVVHCGDVGSRECLEALAELGVKAYAVGGNMDLEDPGDPGSGLPQPTEVAGVTFAWESLAFPVAPGVCVAVAHGHDPFAFAELVNEPTNKFILHGHTHCQRDERVERDGPLGPVHIINPGALCKPRNPNRPTAALLDTETDTVEFIDV